MRTHNSTRNVFMAVAMSIVTILIGLVAQRVFINTLGAEYLGINGLFTSIVSMLALVELGLGSAIYYHLYKPMADGDTNKVKSLVDFYKRGYRLISITVFVLGILLIPFLSMVVGEISIEENIYIIYLLFLLDVVFSYLLTYKRAVLYVDQNNHIISAVHLSYLIALNILQIIVLLVTGDFYLYLIVKIVMRFMENVVLTYITNKKYTYLKDKSVTALDSVTKSDIYKKIRGLSYHKVSSYIVLGTDNILISVFFGLVTVGLYSNYYLVIAAIIMVVSQAFTALTASVGNLLVAGESSRSFDVYKKVRFANFWLSCFATTSLLVVMDSFVSLWVGAQYVLPFGVLVALCINLYLTLIRFSTMSFKEAAGIFHEDRFVPIVESITNIVFSLVLLHYLGLAGVFLGTALSTMILHLFSYPKYVYKTLFKNNYTSYYKDLIKGFLITIVIASVTFAISKAVVTEGDLTKFIVNVLLCVLIPNIILYIIFRNDYEFRFYKKLIKKTIRIR